MILSLGGYGPWLPPVWAWFLALVVLHVIGALPAGSQATSDWRRLLDWLRLHAFAVGLGLITLIGICIRLIGVGSDLGHTPIDVDERRLATAVLHFFRTGEVDHSTVESYPGVLFWLLTGCYLLVYLTALMQGVAANLDRVPFERFVLGGRVTNDMLAAATIVLTGLLGRKLGGRRAGFTAALIVAVTPLPVEISGQLRDEPAQGLLVLAAVFAAVMLARSASDEVRGGGEAHPPATFAVLAGGFAGAATAVKYSSIFALLPALLASAFPAATANDSGASPWREILRRLGLVLLAFFAVLATTNHFLWADFPNFIRQLSTEVSMSGEDHWSAQKNPAWFYSRILGRQGPGWALLVLAAGYGAWGVGARRASPLILAAFPLSYLWFMTQRPSQFPRWVYPLAPFVAVAGTTALCAVVDRVRRWLPVTKRLGIVTARWLSASVMLAVLAQPLWRGAVLLSRSVATPTYRLVEAWLRDHAAVGDRVLVDDGWLDFKKGTALRVHRVPNLRAVLKGGIYPLCYNDWVVVPEPDMGQRQSLERLHLAETFLADYSFGGNYGFDFAVYATPRLQPSEETVDFVLDQDGARSYLGTDWPPPEAGNVGRSLPAEGASVYLPPLRYAARLDIELQVAPPQDGEGAAVAPAPAGSVPALIVVDLEGAPLPAEKVMRNGTRISWSSAPIAAGVLDRGVVKLRLAPLAESTRIHVLRLALRR